MPRLPEVKSVAAFISMPNPIQHKASSEETESCGNCQHSVDVRGLPQVVCLAFLSLHDPRQEGECPEFECKRSKAGNRAEIGPADDVAPVLPPAS